jgi:hypothetical protein
MAQLWLAMDEMFELFNGEFLISDYAFDQIANRDYANQSFFM